MRNDAWPDRVYLKAPFHEAMLRVIHNERSGMRPQLITDMPLEGVMQFVREGEFADCKVR